MLNCSRAQIWKPVGQNCGNFKGHGSENYGGDSQVDFLKKKYFFILFIYFFFFLGGGGHICANYWGGPPVPPPPYSYGPGQSGHVPDWGGKYF